MAPGATAFQHQANDNLVSVPLKVWDHAKDLPLPAYATAQAAELHASTH